MDLKYLFSIILLLGVIFLSIKFIEQFLKTKKANDKKKKDIESKVDKALKTYANNLEKINKDYEDLRSEFLEYKKLSENAISEMEEYTEKVTSICNNIIDFDKIFDDKLNLWAELLNDPKNSAKVQEQIKEYMNFDIKLHKKMINKQNEERLILKNKIQLHMELT